MNTKAATTQIRIQQWTEIIQDRNTSGLTVDDYCESHGLSRNQYYYWLRRVKARILESTPQIVELKMPATVLAVSGPAPVQIQPDDEITEKLQEIYHLSKEEAERYLRDSK